MIISYETRGCTGMIISYEGCEKETIQDRRFRAVIIACSFTAAVKTEWEGAVGDGDVLI